MVVGEKAARIVVAEIEVAHMEPAVENLAGPWRADHKAAFGAAGTHTENKKLPSTEKTSPSIDTDLNWEQ